MTLPRVDAAEYSFPSEGKHLDSLLDSTARFNLWHGSVRSAKTITSAFRWFEFVTSNEVPASVPLMMFGQTQETLRRNVIDPLADMFPGRVEWQAGMNQARIGHRTVYAMGAGDVRAYRRIRGITLGGAYLDEASLVSEEFFNMLMSRLSVPGAKLFATTNPETPAHWLWRRWIKRAADLDMRVFHFLLDDNPWLDPGYVDNLKTEYIGVWYRRYILGQWVAAEGAIWPAFDPDLHVVDEVPAQLLRGRESIDYGTVNPLVDLLAGVGTGPDGKERIYITREWRWDSRERGLQLTDGQYSTRLTEWRRQGYAAPEWQSSWGGGPAGVTPERVLVDPSAASFIHQLQADSVAGVTGANNEVAYGLRSVGSLLAADRLRIHRSCQGLIEEAIAYSWDEKAAGRGEEKPVKAADHGCLVAGTLVSTEQGPVPIERVRPGDQVQTRAGLSTVLTAGQTGTHVPVVDVVTTVGTIRCTPDHPFLLADGSWQPAHTLRYGSTLLASQRRDGIGAAKADDGTWVMHDAYGRSHRTGTAPTGFGSVSVLAVTDTGRDDVWNLSVDGPLHEFVAGNVVVGNCDALRYLVLDLWPVWRGWLRNAGAPRGTDSQ